MAKPVLLEVNFFCDSTTRTLTPQQTRPTNQIVPFCIFFLGRVAQHFTRPYRHTHTHSNVAQDSHSCAYPRPCLTGALSFEFAHFLLRTLRYFCIAGFRKSYEALSRPQHSRTRELCGLQHGARSTTYVFLLKGVYKCTASAKFLAIIDANDETILLLSHDGKMVKSLPEPKDA